jgi:cytochrome c nitrite reductase small subunit
LDMNDKLTPTNPAPPRGRFAALLKDPRWLRISLYAGAVAIFFLFAFAVAMPVSSNPAVCGLCHSMQADVATWKNSTHAKVTCAACHINPGAASLFKEHIAGGGREVYAQLTRTYGTPINSDSKLSKQLTLDACLRCHSPANREVTPTKGLVMDSRAHVKHLDAGLTCTTCHNRVAHQEEDETNSAYLDGMDMFQGCFRCHLNSEPFVADNGRQAPTACNACHTDDAPQPENHLQVVSSGSRWIERHGPVARQDIEACQRCHSGGSGDETGIASCADCHGVKVPHEVAFKEDHGKSAKGIEDKCRTCHKGEANRDFCQQCHHGLFKTPGTWVSSAPGVSSHPAAVRNEGVPACLDHHTPVFCSRCHIRGPEEYRQYQETYLLKERG